MGTQLTSKYDTAEKVEQSLDRWEKMVEMEFNGIGSGRTAVAAYPYQSSTSTSAYKGNYIKPNGTINLNVGSSYNPTTAVFTANAAVGGAGTYKVSIQTRRLKTRAGSPTSVMHGACILVSNTPYRIQWDAVNPSEFRDVIVKLDLNETLRVGCWSEGSSPWGTGRIHEAIVEYDAPTYSIWRLGE